MAVEDSFPILSDTDALNRLEVECSTRRPAEAEFEAVLAAIAVSEDVRATEYMIVLLFRPVT